MFSHLTQNGGTLLSELILVFEAIQFFLKPLISLI